MMIYKVWTLYVDAFDSSGIYGILQYVKYYALFFIVFTVSVGFSTLTSRLPNVSQFFINCAFAGVLSGSMAILPFVKTEEWNYCKNVALKRHKAS